MFNQAQSPKSILFICKVKQAENTSRSQDAINAHCFKDTQLSYDYFEEMFSLHIFFSLVSTELNDGF
jgi:hypothetical protein